MSTYQIEMLWQCSICRHRGNRGLNDRYCCNCGHKKDESDPEYMPDDTSEAVALYGEAKRKAEAGADWVCKYCEANQNQLNKCCGNCGGDRDGTRLVSPAQAERIGAEVREDFEKAQRDADQLGRKLDELAARSARSDAPVSALAEAEDEPPPRAWRLYALGAVAAVLLGTLLWWLFTPHLVEAKVSQLYWQHDTLIERYQVYRREGFTPSFSAFDVYPVGMRHHHYDHVHVGSHQESYRESYACGETCTTSPGYRTCSSNKNGSATCTNHSGSRSCSTKYCSRTAYRTVQDYRDVSRQQMWFAWKVWDWGYNRTVTRSGFTHKTAWPTEGELTAWLGDGERERSSRKASYKVTFSDLKDGEQYVIRPTAGEFEGYDIGARYRLKVNVAGMVQVLP